MRAAQRIASNTSVILVGKILGSVLSLATLFLLTGNLSKSEFGQYKFVFIYIGVFSVITEMGMSPILVREMARNRDRAGEILGTGIIVKIGFSFFSFLAALTLLPFIKQDDYLYRLVFILGLQLFVYPLLTCVNIFKLELKMVYPTVVDLSRNVIYLGGIWYVLQTPRLGLPHIIGLAMVTSFGVMAVLYWISRRYVRIRYIYRPEIARDLIRASIPLGLSQLAIMCYYRVDAMMLMLMPMKGEEAVGYYSLAVSIAEVFNYFPSAFMVSVYPFMAQLWRENRQKFSAATEFSIRTLLALGLLIAIMGSIFARQIISIVPGSYDASADSLVYLIWAEVFIFLNMVFYNALNAMNRERWNLWITLFMLACNIGLNLSLIPRYSHPGASLATLTTEAWGFILLGSLVFTQIRFHLDLDRLIRTTLAGGVLALIVWWTNHAMTIQLPGAILIMFFGTLFYLVLLYILKVIDLKELKHLLHKSSNYPS